MDTPTREPEFTAPDVPGYRLIGPLDRTIMSEVYKAQEISGEQRAGPHKTFHLLFTNTKGRAIRRDHFNESAWHKALPACGITPAGKSTGIHQLRHHVASLLLAQGMSIAEVAEVLGDTVQEVSETYAHAMPDFRSRLRAINASREVRITAAREESGTG